MQPKRLILIEFNELCPSLLGRFMDQGLIPNFRRFYEASSIFTTDAGEAPPNLEPWIQWPTVHSGMSFGEHGIFHLGDGRKLRQKCIAELISDAGHPVGVCASMNLNYGRVNGYVLPDPWDKDGAAHPDWLQPFYRVIASKVQEASRDGAMTRAEMLQLGWFLARNGLSINTARTIAWQLWQERRDPGLRWQRACLLDQLLYDVSRSLNRRFDVRFATFFCNSTAHFQHYFWRNLEPERFTVAPPESDHPSLQEAIPHGYQRMDRLIGRFLRDYPDDLLVLCTALSQQPWTDTTKCTFRPHRFETLLEFAGIAAKSSRIKPVMAEEFHLECPTIEAANEAEERLLDLTLDGEPLILVERKDSNVFAGCRINDPAALDRQVRRERDGVCQRFGDLFYMIHTMRSGRHHPDGVLWFRNDQHRVIEERVPLTAVAPTILAHFGIRPPDHMRTEPLPVESPHSALELARA